MFLECGDVPGFLIIHSGNRNVFSCKLQNKNDGFQGWIHTAVYLLWKPRHLRVELPHLYYGFPNVYWLMLPRFFSTQFQQTKTSGYMNVTYPWQQIGAFKVSLDESVFIFPLLVFTLNDHPVADCLHAHFVWLELGHVQFHFELFVIIQHLKMTVNNYCCY